MTTKALSMAEIFKMAKYSPHLQQAKVHASATRNRVLAGGRRFGKSEVGAGELDIEAAVTKYMLSRLEEERRRREFWIVGPEYTDSEKEFRKHYDALKAAGAPMDKPGTYYDPHSGDLQLSMFKGKYLVIGKSAKHPERLVGEGLSGVIMAEAAKQRERTWTKYIRPTLADYQGWSLHSSTPEGKNWFYELYKRGQDPNDTSWESWRFGSWDNPYVYPKGASPQGLAMLRAALEKNRSITPALRKASGVDDEIIEFMLDLTQETFNQEIAADFTEFAGRVFKEFDEDIHVGDFAYNPAWRTYAASDYGFTDPFVWLLIQIDPNNNVYVLDEIYESGLTIDDAARRIKARGLDPSGLIEFYPDPARPDDTLALERHLQIRANTSTGGELDTRLRYIREALRVPSALRHLPEDHPERVPRLRFDRKCPNTINDFLNYKYPDTYKLQRSRARNTPLDRDNHGPEAVGRFFRGHYGDPNSAHPGGGARSAGSNLARGRGTRRQRR